MTKSHDSATPVPGVPLDTHAYGVIGELLEVEDPWPDCELETGERLDSLLRSSLTGYRYMRVFDTALRRASIQFDFGFAVGVLVGALGHVPDDETASAVLASAAEHVDRKYADGRWPLDDIKVSVTAMDQLDASLKASRVT